MFWPELVEFISDDDVDNWTVIFHDVIWIVLCLSICQWCRHKKEQVQFGTKQFLIPHLLPHNSQNILRYDGDVVIIRGSYPCATIATKSSYRRWIRVS